MFLTIVIFFAVLSVIVLAHEWGHFITARKTGMEVEEFGIGFPPRLWSIKKGKVVYSFNLIPIGGFVKIKGEDGDDKESEDSFAHKKIWQRALVISAGVIMNIVLAAALLSFGFMIGIPQAIDHPMNDQAVIRDQKLQIVEILKGYPAKEAGIEQGDIILDINGKIFKTRKEMSEYLKNFNGRQVLVNLQRGNKFFKKELTPVILKETGNAGIGVGLVQSGIVSYPIPLAIWNGLKATYTITIAIIFAFYELIKNLIIGNGLTAEIAGPVGIAAYTGRVAQLGFAYLLQFTALLSLNLAIINFLPFPALDGGRFLFLIIEKIRRRPVDQKIEAMIHNVGFSLLILLVIAVTFKDVSRFSDKLAELWQRIIN